MVVMVVVALLATAGVAAAMPVNDSLPSLSPSPSVTAGSAVTLTQGTWDSASYTLSDAWQVCTASNSCTPLSVSGDSYTPTDSEDGETISVVETATDSTDGSQMTASSNSVAVVLPAPTNSVAPDLTGTANQGQILSTTPGTWSPSSPAPTYSYVWYHCPSGGACTPSSTSTNSDQYTVTSADAGDQIEVQVTATNDGGSNTATSNLTSASVGLPVNTTVPSITDANLQVGSTLSIGGDVWTNSPTLTYEWMRCSSTCAATGGTGATYVLASADVNDTIEVVVTATNADGTATATSAPTGTVVLTAPTLTASPTVPATAAVGQNLTLGAAHWTGSSLTITTQWSLCDSDGNNCVAIAGATGAQYTVAPADAGGTLQVTQVATNSGGSATGFSGLSEVTGPPPTPESSPGVTGTPSVGSTLTATRASFTDNPGVYNYQWQRCSAQGCTDISGATAQSYVPTAADAGYTLQVLESATNNAGTSPTTQSPDTAVITVPTAVLLQTGVARPVAGQSVSLIATVSSPAASLEAGTVTFSANGKAIPGCAGIALGADPTQPVICHTAFAAANHTVVATFTPVSGIYVTGSASTATPLDVRKVATTIALTSGSRVTLGKPFTYRATVRPGSSGSLKPGGTVAFVDAKKTIKGCARQPLHNAVATCTVRYQGVQTHSISLRYRGNADFAAARSAARRITVAAQNASGVVTAFMSWTFAFGPTSTGVRALSVSGLATDTKISMTCAGGGCAFQHYTKTVSAPTHCKAHHRCKAPTSLNLAPAFHHQRLRVGTSLTVTVSHPGWVGKFYRFTIRHSRQPALLESCLAVGGTRPSVGCSPAS